LQITISSDGNSNLQSELRKQIKGAIILPKIREIVANQYNFRGKRLEKPCCEEGKLSHAPRALLLAFPNTENIV